MRRAGLLLRLVALALAACSKLGPGTVTATSPTGAKIAIRSGADPTPAAAPARAPTCVVNVYEADGAEVQQLDASAGDR